VTTAAQITDFEVPPRLGPVVGLTRIGNGAMGAMYRGRHETMGIDVAVKILNPQVGRKEPVTVQRFVREVRLLATIHDPQVLRIFDAGQDGEFTYALMELVEGQTLEQLLEAEPEGRMAPDAAAYYIARVALGLEAIHCCGIVHRDIKPDNVMVDSAGSTKIIDFGLARGQDSVQLTMMDEVVGTPEYMAPEMIAHTEVDGRADQYSLGVTAYQLLSGRTPFNEGTLLQIVQMHLHKQPVPIQARNPNVPYGLAALVDRLLAKSPQARFPSMQDAASAFTVFAAKAPPHRPAPRARLAGGAQGGEATLLPSWEELFLARLLAERKVYPLDTLVRGLDAWRQQPLAGPFKQFLVKQGGLPEAVSERAILAARQRLSSLRDRIAYSILRQSALVAPEVLASLARNPPPPGQPLTAHLVDLGQMAEPLSFALDGKVDECLELAVRRCTSAACQQLGVPPAPLGQLDGKHPRFGEVYRATVTALLSQLQ